MSDELDVEHWARLIDERGHAGVFARKTAAEKEIVEKGTASEWVIAVAAEFGLQVRHLRKPPTDPPDLLGEVAGQSVSIELVELVDGGLLRDLARARKATAPELSGRERFDRTQWNEHRLLSELEKLLDQKQRRYAKREPLDYLIIHSAEPWLQPTQVQKWLEGKAVKPRPAFSSAYLLLWYDPSYRPHWPVFRLF